MGIGKVNRCRTGLPAPLPKEFRQGSVQTQERLCAEFAENIPRNSRAPG